MLSRERISRVAAFLLCGLIISVWVWLQVGPSIRHARASVHQIVFVQGRTLLSNGRSELFASDDGGRTWRELRERVPTLTVANGHELWGAHGWPGHHERASASIWRSLDRGDTWSTVELALPASYGPELHARLPAAFLQEPDDEPLLAMSDLQLVRPRIIADSTRWLRIGGRVPGDGHSRGTDDSVAGQKYGRSIYVASPGSIAFSDDDGRTWSDATVRRAHTTEVRCIGRNCYALLTGHGSEWNELWTTEAGTNHWSLLRTLDVAAVAAALVGESRAGPVHSFGACAMVAAADAIHVAGIVNAGTEPWGIVLRVGLDGALTTVGGTVPDGLWIVERAPDGVLWAGGKGAYRLQGGAWVRAWPEPD